MVSNCNTVIVRLDSAAATVARSILGCVQHTDARL